jgi:hypothetical protein
MKRFPILFWAILWAGTAHAAKPPKPAKLTEEVDTLAASGKLVLALEKLKALEEAAQKKKATRKEQDALRALRETLEKRLAHLEIAVPAALEITVDEHAESRSDVPLDPGKHTVSAKNANGDILSDTVTLAEGERLKWTKEFPKTAPVKAVEKKQDRTGPNVQKTIGWITVGVGVAALGVGSYFAIAASGTNDDLAGKCPATRCPSEYQGLQDSRNQQATLSTAFVIGGALALATGAVLVLTSKSSPRTDLGLGTLRIVF